MIDLLGTADVTYIIIKLARTALSAYEYYIITTKNILQNGKKMLIFLQFVEYSCKLLFAPLIIFYKKEYVVKCHF